MKRNKNIPFLEVRDVFSSTGLQGHFPRLYGSSLQPLSLAKQENYPAANVNG